MMSIFFDYDECKYLYPPRAESAIRADQLDCIGNGWVAQPKYNGSCAVLFLNGKKEYKIYNRFGKPLTLQQPLNYTQLNDSDKYMVLCGEYLNKNKRGEGGLPFNHKFIIWDILVWQGRYLVGQTLEERLSLMLRLFGSSRSLVTNDRIIFFKHLHTTTVENVFMAPSYLGDFKSLYYEITETELYEGLVLKKSAARLELGFKEKNNSSWQVKARKETRSYKF
jgi:ATP-dependent DNA ligase